MLKALNAMFEKRLSLDSLHVHPEEVYRQMGYGKDAPDERTAVEVMRLLTSASQIAVPRYCYRVMDGSLYKEMLRVDTSFILVPSLCGSWLEQLILRFL